MSETTPKKFTLTSREMKCLANIRKNGQFRTDSQTIGECLIFIQLLIDNPNAISNSVAKRFGINWGI